MSGTKDHMGSSVEYYQRRQRIGKQVDLNGQVILDKWATPQASDHVEGARTAKESNQKCLGRDLNQMNWQTPNEGDAARTGSKEAWKEYKEQNRTTQCRLRNQIQAEEVKQNWPTPRAGNPGSRKPGTGGKILAEEAKKNWPTPTAMSRPRSEETMEKCLKFRKSKGKNSVPLYLEEEIRIQEAKKHNGPPAPEKSSTIGKNQGSWPTPTSNAVTGGQTGLAGGSGTRASLEKKLGRTEAMKLNAKLNPNWVEQLMGLPIGWTDLGSWATESSPKPQN
jgi:hypothetical protein